MRSITMAAAAALVLALGASVGADHHEKSDGKVGYFDAHNCTICKTMGQQEELMKAMKWETHKIDNGMVMVSRMPEEMVSQYNECCAQMEAVAAKVMSGQVKDAVCCGFCKDFGKMMAAGAKMQKVKTQTGGIMIVTADKPATVKMIHKVADRSNKEMEKMASAS